MTPRHAAVVGRRRLHAAMAIASMLALTAMLASASLALASPKGEYSVFAECPTTAAGVETCLYAKTESGEFVLGKEKVPITNPVILQGGLVENPETGALTFVGAKTVANTLPKSAQNVPGGLLGLVNCKEISNIVERVACEATLENGLTGVKATPEAAGAPTSVLIKEGNLVEETGTALQLPLRVHLENPLLGNECYIGSLAHPIVIAFTTGTTSPPPPNKPLKGSKGVLSFNEAGTIQTISKNSLVNNSYAAPEVTGCGGVFAFLLDPIIDKKIGLPATAGLNTAILNGTLKEGSAAAIKVSE